jgi:hypothetical protein
MDEANFSKASDTDLAAEVRGLKSLLYAALLALIVLGAAVDFYLGKQMRIVQRQFYAQQKSTEDAERLVRKFMAAMESFAATNKDFQPILERYRPAFGNQARTNPSASDK